MAVHTEAKARHLPDRNAGVPILRSLGLSLPMEARTQTLRIGDRVFSECTGPMRVMSVDAFWHSSASVWLVADGPDLHPPEQGVRLSMFEDLDKAACVLKTFPITITPGAVEATPRGANP